VAHTQRVLYLAELLGCLEKLDEPARAILALAAVYHDIGRTSDGVDPAHGYASFGKADRMGLIQPEQHEGYQAIKYLIETHCISDREGLRLVNGYGMTDTARAARLLMFFKDADGLDRVRINDLNPDLLRLPVSPQLVRLAEEQYAIGSVRQTLW
jgi:hypothetical protein